MLTEGKSSSPPKARLVTPTPLCSPGHNQHLIEQWSDRGTFHLGGTCRILGHGVGWVGGQGPRVLREATVPTRLPPQKRASGHPGPHPEKPLSHLMLCPPGQVWG